MEVESFGKKESRGFLSGSGSYTMILQSSFFFLRGIFSLIYYIFVLSAYNLRSKNEILCCLKKYRLKQRYRLSVFTGMH